VPGRKPQGALVIGIFGLQWAVLALLPVPGYGAGVLSPEGNAARHVDALLLGWFGPRQASDADLVLMPTAGAVATTLIGVLAGHWLRSSIDLNARLAGLFTAGLLLLMLGSAWDVVLPINKQL
jgi:predicted acyltransferase